MEPILKLIKKISIVNVHQLEGKLIAVSGFAIVTDPEIFYQLPVVGFGECRESSKVQDHQILHTVTLTFNLRTRFNTKNQAYAFLLETVNDECLLLGTHNHPFCKITTEDVYPSKPSDKSVTKVTVELTDKQGLRLVFTS